VFGSSLNRRLQLGHCKGLCLDHGKLWTLTRGVRVAAVGLG
jgi:hypothetical protein